MLARRHSGPRPFGCSAKSRAKSGLELVCPPTRDRDGGLYKLERTAFEGEHEGSTLCLAVDPQGKLCASGGSDRTLRVYDVETKRLLGIASNDFHSDWVSTCAFSDNGSLLISGSVDGSLFVWNCRNISGRTLRPSPLGSGHRAGVSRVSVHSRLCMTSGYDGALRLWDLDTRVLLQEMQPPLLNERCNLATSGGRLSPVVTFLWRNALAVSATKDGSLAVYDVNRGTPQAEPLAFFSKAHRGPVSCLAFAAFGSGEEDAETARGLKERQNPIVTILASGGRDDGAVLLWDLRCMDSPCCVVKAHAGSVNDVLFLGSCAEGASVFCTISSSQKCKAWDSRKLVDARGEASPLHSVSCKASLLCGQVLHDGRKELAVGGSDGEVRVLSFSPASQTELLGKATAVKTHVSCEPGVAVTALKSVVRLAEKEEIPSVEKGEEEDFLLKRRHLEVKGLVAMSCKGTLSHIAFL